MLIAYLTYGQATSKVMDIMRSPSTTAVGASRRTVVRRSAPIGVLSQARGCQQGQRQQQQCQQQCQHPAG